MIRPILIVGAGPVGLTMAAALNLHGAPVRIIDKAPAPSDKSKALAVWCRSMELLDRLRLAETFVNNGLKLSAGCMHANGKQLLHLKLTTDESPFGFPLMIPQNITERLLTEYLLKQGVAVERPVELIAFGETSDGVRCTLRHDDGREESIDAAWLVGCDGAHSTVRHTLGLEFTGHAEPNDWMLADVHVSGPLARDEVSIYWHEKGVVAFFPIDRARVRMMADMGVASKQALPASLTLADAQAKVDERGPTGLILSNPVWLSYFRINERKVADYRLGRAMLAGDAAHIHSPAGGQGMNTGMQDAFNLAWKLALVAKGQGRAEPLLHSYSVERSAVGDLVLTDAERFTTLATLKSPIAQWLRNHLVPVFGSLNVVQDKVRNEWFEFAINYRHSPLVGESWPPRAGGLAAGDRLCDAPLIGENDERTSLFAILRDTRHLLLLLPASPTEGAIALMAEIAAVAERAFPGVCSTHLILPPKDLAHSSPNGSARHGIPTWQDADNRLHQKLHAHSPTLILVRPDGYIGFRCQPASAEKLRTFLASYLIPAGV